MQKAPLAHQGMSRDLSLSEAYFFRLLYKGKYSTRHWLSLLRQAADQLDNYRNSLKGGNWDKPYILKVKDRGY